MSQWPREYEGHMLTRNLQLDPSSGDTGGYRCVHCGTVFEELDRTAIRQAQCGTSAP